MDGTSTPDYQRTWEIELTQLGRHPVDELEFLHVNDQSVWECLELLLPAGDSESQ